MAGIAGLWDQAAQHTADSLLGFALRMGETLRQSGADSNTVWIEATQGLALSHPHPAGEASRFVMAYAGTLYNQPALAAALRAAGHAVADESDPAVFQAALAAWGLTETLTRCNGSFAFALWDKESKTLTLARDRLGVQPLYWTQQGTQILFGSQLRALLQHPACSRTVDRLALAHYFRTGNVPAPDCIFAGVHKLPPATTLTFALEQEPQRATYWDLVARANTPPDTSLDYTTAVEQLHHLLRTVVKEQALQASSCGVLLSGGMNDNLVAALAQEASAQPLNSFALCFARDAGASSYTQAVAAHLGLTHTETHVTEAEAQAIIPSLLEINDAPLADSAQIPTLLLAKATRQQVAGIWSGMGGDEGFLGYSRYRALEELANYPPLFWYGIATASKILPPAYWNKIGQALPSRWQRPHLGDQLAKLAVLGYSEAADAYHYLTSQWQNPEEIVADITPLPRVLPYPAPEDPITAMQLWDTLGTLPDQALTRIDRANRSVNLAAHLPLLDHRVLALSWSLPRPYKLAHGTTKKILRSVLAGYLPQDLLRRAQPKMQVPLAAWLRGGLRDWAENLLSSSTLTAAGLEPAPIRALWAAHLAEQGDHQDQLWSVLIYSAWRQQWNIA